MPNEVKILVRVYNSGKAGFDAVNRDVDDYAKKFSETFTKRFAESITQNFNQVVTQRLHTAVDAAGRDVGDRMGNTISERITTRISDRLRTVRDRVSSSSSSRSSSSSSSDSGGFGRDREHVRVDVDVDKKSFLERIGELGKEAGDKLGAGLQGGITSVFSGDVISTAIKAGLISLGIVVIAPALGAAISAGVLLALGGGAIGAGVYSAIKNNPQIKAGFKTLADMAKDEFKSFGENFTGPVANFAENLLGVFRQIKPQVDDLGKSLGPVADQLGDGVIGFLQNILPSIIRGMKASEPLIKVLADKLPGIGDAMGRFFDHISQNAPEAATFLNDLLTALEYIIRLLGLFISGLTQMYIFARRVFTGLVTVVLDTAQTILDAAEIAFGWIPGLGPKVYKANEDFRHFADNVKKKLREIPRDVNVKVRISVLGLSAANAALRTARLLASMASGGVAHAAEGGPRTGLTLVGEQGPELIDLAPGSTVHTAGDSRRMMAGAAGPQRLDIRLTAGRTAERGLVAELVRVLRAEIGDHYGGNVQLALGR